MGRIEPDMSVFKQMRNQPEFNEQIWQYINRRVSDWRIIAGKEALRKNEALFARIEQDYGVERGTLLALWGVESAFGDPLVQQNHMRPVFPSLAALAWNEPRRQAYWESRADQRACGSSIAAGARRRRCEGRGPARWDIPNGCRKSGSMSASITTMTAGYRRSASRTTRWVPPRAIWSIAANITAANIGAMKSARPAAPPAAAAATRHGPAPASPAPTASRFRNRMPPRKLWIPEPGGPAFLLGPNFYSVRSYNPSMNYALAICHLGDRILGAPPFLQPFPGSERALTLAEVQEMQVRLDESRFRHRRHRRPRRQRHHEGGQGLPDEDGTGARRRLWRAEGAGAVATRRLGPPHPARVHAAVDDAFGPGDLALTLPGHFRSRSVS